MRTIFVLATLLLALPALAGHAAADPAPCERPIFEAEWCPPPTFGPYSIRVCNATLDFVCMMLV